jgi:hypothetical protein
VIADLRCHSESSSAFERLSVCASARALHPGCLYALPHAPCTLKRACLRTTLHAGACRLANLTELMQSDRIAIEQALWPPHPAEMVCRALDLTVLQPELSTVTGALAIRCGGRTISNLTPTQALRLFGPDAVSLHGCTYTAEPATAAASASGRAPAPVSVHNSIVSVNALAYLLVRACPARDSPVPALAEAMSLVTVRAHPGYGLLHEPHLRIVACKRCSAAAAVCFSSC